MWFTSALAYLEDNNADPCWVQLVSMWQTFEEKQGHHATSHRLPATKRPESMTKWLSGRKYHALPKITKPDAFSTSWLAWWNDLQPQWRRSLDNGLPAPFPECAVNQNPASMKNIKGGPNGLVAVIIGLKWWMPSPGSEFAETWTKAVLDVTETLKFTISSNGGKRPATEQTGGRGKKARKA
ncbi:hypothetical protein CPC08DRAFT_649322 [Agrocybe pediades]|nr:hypothetical protein CPC08DRAFT_649322 [Agrocybe pediades]